MSEYFIPIFTDATANVTGPTLVYSQPSSAVNFMAWGTFDTASVYLEWSINGTDWVRFKQNGVDLVWTEADMFLNQRLDFNVRIRGVIESVGAGTSISLGYAIS